MNRTLALTLSLISCVAAAAAIAHPGGHGEDEYAPRPTFDCSAMAGDYAAGGKEVVKVTVADGTVTFTPGGKDAASGTCVSPLFADGESHPRALATFGTAFGAKFETAGCCIVHLKYDRLFFDNGEVWKRRKP